MSSWHRERIDFAQSLGEIGYQKREPLGDYRMNEKQFIIQTLDDMKLIPVRFAHVECRPPARPALIVFGENL